MQRTHQIARLDGTIYAARQIGLWRISDSGWERNLFSQWRRDEEIEALCLAAYGDTLLAGIKGGMAISFDEGDSWDHHKFPSFDPGGSSYCRNILVRPDNPDVMFVGNGNGIPGVTGAIRRTVDGGATWDTPELPVTPNSVVYCFSAHGDVPDCVAAASIYGYLYLSDDGGETWRKLDREFGEIRTVAISPN